MVGIDILLEYVIIDIISIMEVYYEYVFLSILIDIILKSGISCIRFLCVACIISIGIIVTMDI